MNRDLRQKRISIIVTLGICAILAALGLLARNPGPDPGMGKLVRRTTRHEDQLPAEASLQPRKSDSLHTKEHGQTPISKRMERTKSRVLPPITVGSQGGIVRREDGVDFNSRIYGATVSKGTLEVGLPVTLEGLDHPRFAYRLREIQLGARKLEFSESEFPSEQLDANNVEYDRGPVVERYSFAAKDLEQTFLIRELPEGRGQIRIVGRVSTNLELPAEGKSASAVSFSWKGKEIIAVSNAVAIDANGVRKQLDLSWSDGSLTYLLPSEWAKSAALPIQIDPTVSSPISVKQYTSPAGDQYVSCSYNSNASNNEWLVAWEQYTGGSNNVISVQGQKVSAAGALTGSLFQINALGTADYQPAIAYCASANRYLAVWSAGGGTLPAGEHIYGRLINADGTLYSPSDIQIELNSNSNGDSYPSVASDGTQFFVAWSRNDPVSGYPGINGAFVSTTGTVGTIKVIEAPSSNYPGSPAVCFSNGTYFITWYQYYGGGTGCTMNTSGTIIVPITTMDSSNPGNLGHAVGGGNVFLGSNLSTGLSGKLFNTSLAATTSEFTIGTPAPAMYTGTYAAAADYYAGDGMFYVVWDWIDGTNTDNLFVTRVDSTGAVWESTSIATGAGQYTPVSISVGAPANEALVAYSNFASSGTYTVQANVLGLVAPPAPPTVTITPGDSQISLSWQAVPGATGYIIEQATASAGPYTAIESPTTNSYTDTSVSNGVTYYYQIASTNVVGIGAFSNPVSATPAAASSISVLFVVGNTTLNSGDSAVLTRLQNLGYTVVTEQDSAALTSDATGKALVVISSTTSPANVGTKFTGLSVPVLSWQSGCFNSLGWTGATLGTNFGTTAGQTQVAMVAANIGNPMAAGLTGTVTLIPSSDSFSWGVPGSGGLSIATLASDSTKSVIFGYDVGATMSNGASALARQVGFFLTSTTAANLNSNGGSLFDAAARWAAGAPTQVTTIMGVLHDSTGHPQINWQAVAGATSYRLLRSTSVNGTYSIVATGLSGYSFTDTTAIPGQTYYFIVEAENAGGLGPLAAGTVDFINELYIFGRTGLRTWTPQQQNANAWNIGTYTAQVIPNGYTVQNGTGQFSLVPQPNGVQLVQNGDYQATITVQQGALPQVVTLQYKITLTMNGNPNTTETPIRSANIFIDQALALNVFLRFPYVVTNSQKQSTRLNVFNSTKATRDAARNALASQAQQQLSIYYNGAPTPPTWTAPNPSMWEQADLGVYVEADLNYNEKLPNNDYTASALLNQFADAWLTKNTFDFHAADGNGADTNQAQLAQSKNNLDPFSINVYFVPHVLLGSTVANAWTLQKWQGTSRRTIFIGDDSPDFVQTLGHELGHCLSLKHPDQDPPGAGILTHNLNNPNWNFKVNNPNSNPAFWYNLMWGSQQQRQTTYLTELQANRAYQTAKNHSAKSQNGPQ